MKEKNLEFGDNVVIGFWKEYAVVYSNDDEQLYGFKSPIIADLLGTCVEKELLEQLPEIPEEDIKQLYEREV